MILNFDDQALSLISKNLTQSELILLQKMKDNCIESPNLAIDESKMITLVKTLSPYKIKFIIQRFMLVSLIASEKVGNTKYYITDVGKRLVDVYIKDTIELKKKNNRKK
jgi:hypothetical protein